MRVVVTRPAGDAASWVDGLLAAGFEPRALPLIGIGPVPDTTALQATWQHLDNYFALMFVSGNAVAHFFASKPVEVHVNNKYIAIKNRVWVTGPGTTRALLQAGVDAGLIDAPAHDAGQFDSEALWAVVRDQVQPGRRVLIVRGADVQQGLPLDETASRALNPGAGRDWFASQVVQSGGEVDFVVAYQRCAPAFSPLQKAQIAAAATDGSVWLFSSSEAIANLQRALPDQSWANARAVATHARIAARAKQAGFGVVCESRPALASVVASIESLR